MRTDAETDDIILAYRNNLSDRTTLYAKLCSSDRVLTGQQVLVVVYKVKMRHIMVLEFSTSSKPVSQLVKKPQAQPVVFFCSLWIPVDPFWFLD